MPQPARWNGALRHPPSPARLGAGIRFGFLNIRRINRRPDVTSNCVLKPPGPGAGCSTAFLGVKKPNEVRVPVVQYLVSQRAGSIRALVTYFVVLRLR
jgi:hypothetical protein